MNLPIRVGTDERVRVRQFSSVSNIVGFSLRMTKDRAGEELLKPVTFSASDAVADRTPQDTAVDVPTGWIQDGSFFQRTPGVKRGQAYVDISLFHFNIPTQRLFTGYLYEGVALPLGFAGEPLEGQGRIVTNEAPSTLVNNTALTRVITVPTNARWRLGYGTILNGDSVDRAVGYEWDDGTEPIGGWLFNENLPVITAGFRLHVPMFPSAQAGAVQQPLLTEGDRINITWAAGGASAGGTARSSANVEEWIEL